MRIRVDDIREQTGLHKKVPLSVALDPVEMGGQVVHFDQPFTGEAEIWNSGDSLLVRARLSGEALVSCSRCLTPVHLPLEVSFDEEFVAGAETAADAGDEEEGDEEGVRTVTRYQGDEIDLTESLRDNVLLELPMKPLCDEQCQGLCPVCGTNRNERECECKESPDADPRLAVFRDLIRKQEPESDS